MKRTFKGLGKDLGKPLGLALLPLSGLTALAAGAAAQQGAMPIVLQSALRPPVAAEQLYAYDFVSISTGKEPSTVRGRVDPSLPEGKRVTITEAIGEKVDAKKIDKRMEKNADGDIWCDRMSGGPAGPVRELAPVEGGRVFSFIPLAKEDAEHEEKKLYEQLTAEVLVDETTRTVRKFTAKLREPWKPAVIARLDAMTMNAECALAPNGRAYLSRSVTHVTGSALGSDFTSEFTRTISNLREVR
jgi:hypothetical protein